MATPKEKLLHQNTDMHHLSQSLNGVRVLDLTEDLSGPFCTKYLADQGADVIKVEDPSTGGDLVRRMSPFLQDIPGLERCGLFAYLNLSKRSISLDLKSAAGRKILKELAKSTDILVEGFPPGVMEGMGVGYEVLGYLNPRLVMTSLSSFGQTGPYRSFNATELIIYAMGGPLFVTGIEGRGPTMIGEGAPELHVGAAAALATIMAFYHAEASGEGEHVDASAMEILCGSVDRKTLTLLSYQYTGDTSRRLPLRSGIGSGVVTCRDGYVEMDASAPEGFRRLTHAIGMPELVEDPRFATPEARSKPENIEAFDVFFVPWLLEHSKKEAAAAFQEHRILAGPVNTPGELFQDLHFRLRGFWKEIEHPFVGSLEYPGRPFNSSETPWQAHRPAPTLGQHNWEILGGELGYSRGELVKLSEMRVI